MTDEPMLDPRGIERLLEITGGDTAFVAELIDSYLEDSAVQVEALREAAAAGNVPNLIRPAHSLKSSSDSIGAVALTSLSRELEAQARGGTVIDATTLVEAIANAFDATQGQLLSARPTA